MKDLERITGKLDELLNMPEELNDANEVADAFNKYWPELKEVLTFVVGLKITRKKVDRDLEEIIELGDKIYSTTSDKEKLQESLDKMSELLENIQKKMGKIKGLLNVIDVFLKEDTRLDDLIDKLKSFIDKMNRVVDNFQKNVLGEESPA